MATSTEIELFWTTIAPLCQAENNSRIDKLLVSVALGQGAYESGYGTSYLATAGKNCYGIRAYSTWSGRIYDRGVGEIYNSYAERQTDDCFKVYDNVSESVHDYYELITGAERYTGAVNNPSYRSALEYIIAGGYTQSDTYVNIVCSIIEGNELTQYDNGEIVNPAPTRITAGDTVVAIKTYQKGNFFLNPVINHVGKQFSVVSVLGDKVKLTSNNIEISLPINILKKI